jgi:hypothetical protein
MMKPPKILYKYFSPNTPFFKGFLARFTQRSELNDPFEMRPSDKGFEEFILSKEGSENLCSVDLKRTIEQKDLSHLPQVTQDGVFCLTEDPLNLLMWSHYASEHKGLVVGFDTSNYFFRQDLYKVTYKNQRIGDITDKELLTTKSNDWMYEKEFRLIRRLHNADVLVNKDIQERISAIKHSNAPSKETGIRLLDAEEAQLLNRLKQKGVANYDPSYIYLFKVPPSAVKTVIFGARSDQSLIANIKDNIAQMISSSSFSIKYQIASLDKNRFELVLADI